MQVSARLQRLTTATIAMTLLSASIYWFIGFSALLASGFPFLVGAILLLTLAVSSVLTVITVAAWARQFARKGLAHLGRTTQWTFIGTTTAGVGILCGEFTSQLWSGDPNIMDSMIGPLLWPTGIAIASLWAGFATAMVGLRTARRDQPAAT